MTFLKKIRVAILFLIALAEARAGQEGLFPFVLPWDDSLPGITNVSSWLDQPAGADGFVYARDGHLYEGQKRIRFLGVNTVFGANFPRHEDAEKIAARMARFGINCVRFHHMDTQGAPAGIMQADLKTLDPAQLDKLDYFIAQLKQHGIYSDLNLHVSRTYPGMPPWAGAPGYFKGVDLFYPPMIELQRSYARQLLTHVNPYTKNAYADEPAVGLIEINNENGLLSEWWSGALDSMPEVYGRDLAKRWNVWLAGKYNSAEGLKKSWNTGTEGLGEEMLKDGNFVEVPSGRPWSLEQHGEAKAQMDKSSEGGLHIQVQQMGTEGWHVQLNQAGLSLEKKQSYTLSFRARADAPRKITVNVSIAGPPWTPLWSSEFDLTTEWKDYRVVFPGIDEAKARLVISNLGAAIGGIWLDRLSLKPGGITGLSAGEALGAIPLFSKKEFGSRSETARKDWMSFLWDVEEDYWTGMSDFIKKDLKAHSLVVGTATGFSPSLVQAKLDVVDSHAYWQHPHFPGKAWDMENWTVKNQPMAGAEQGGAFSGMALRKVAGKPFICTEYNEAAPNTYAGETFLLISAYAALQDWDGIFFFAWSHRTDDSDARKITGFFDVDQHPVKMATMPAAAALFLCGDVAAARKVIQVPVSRDNGIDQSLRAGPWWDLSAFMVGKNIPLQSGTEMKVVETSDYLPQIKPDQEMQSLFVSDTKELTWDSVDRRVLIDTERSKAVIGKTGMGPVGLGDVSVEVTGSVQDWAAVSLTVMEGSNFHSPGKILVTASGTAENTEMVWKSPEKKSVGKNWGKAPSLVEGIKARIELPVSVAKIQAWALNEQGQKGKEIPVRASGNKTILDIGPEYQTLWYEVDVK